MFRNAIKPVYTMGTRIRVLGDRGVRSLAAAWVVPAPGSLPTGQSAVVGRPLALRLNGPFCQGAACRPGDHDAGLDQRSMLYNRSMVCS